VRRCPPLKKMTHQTPPPPPPSSHREKVGVSSVPGRRGAQKPFQQGKSERRKGNRRNRSDKTPLVRSYKGTTTPGKERASRGQPCFKSQGRRIPKKRRSTAKTAKRSETRGCLRWSKRKVIRGIFHGKETDLKPTTTEGKTGERGQGRKWVVS